MADTATLIQYRRQTGSTPSYTVPAGGGVVTSWTHMAPDPIGFAETMALQMLRPVSGSQTQFTVIGQSAVQTLINGPNTFPAQIPVQAGDVLGLYVQHAGNVAYCQEAAPMFNEGDKTREIDFTQNPAVGTILDFVGNEQSARLSVSAVVEKDADGDGLATRPKTPVWEPLRRAPAAAPAAAARATPLRLTPPSAARSASRPRRSLQRPSSPSRPMRPGRLSCVALTRSRLRIARRRPQSRRGSGRTCSRSSRSTPQATPIRLRPRSRSRSSGRSDATASSAEQQRT